MIFQAVQDIARNGTVIGRALKWSKRRIILCRDRRRGWGEHPEPQTRRLLQLLSLPFGEVSPNARRELHLLYG